MNSEVKKDLYDMTPFEGENGELLNPCHTIFGHECVEWGLFEFDDFWGPYEDGRQPEAIVADPGGMIHIKLRKNFRIDLTLNNCIRLINEESGIVIALSPDGRTGSIEHPVGAVFYKNDNCDLRIDDGVTCHKNVRFCEKGLAFTVPIKGVVYMLDSAGTKTCNQKFVDTTGSVSISVFEDEALMGRPYIESCSKILRCTYHYLDARKNDNWMINGVHIIQYRSGAVKVVFGKNNEYELKTSANTGTVLLSTPDIYCTASAGIQPDDPYYEAKSMFRSERPHLFVKKGVRRVHHDGLTCQIRTENRTVELDAIGMLKMV